MAAYEAMPSAGPCPPIPRGKSIVSNCNVRTELDLGPGLVVHEFSIFFPNRCCELTAEFYIFQSTDFTDGDFRPAIPTEERFEEGETISSARPSTKLE